MKTIWLFRSNIREFEYYHLFESLEEYEQKCHDFYIQMGLFYLKKGLIKNFIVWRLKNKKWRNRGLNRTFKVGDGQFIELFVDDFSECYSYDIPADISFFRGGFPEYDIALSKELHTKNIFGKKIYCGCGPRVFPRYDDYYDKILVEDDREINNTLSIIPFYKTAVESIFYHIEDLYMRWDVCWPCNFEQIRQKGQEFFIKSISESEELKKLRIVHVGNKPEVGSQMCEKYNVTNIKFYDWKHRVDLNEILSQSKVGIVCSNRSDGCPRIATEILQSKTPLIIRESTRILKYFKEFGTRTFKDNDIVSVITDSVNNYKSLRKELIDNKDHFSMETICMKNWKEWTKKIKFGLGT